VKPSGRAMHRHGTPTPRWVLVAWAALAALLLYLPHTANAAAPPPPEGWGAAEFKMAQAYWGVEVPPLCETIEVAFDVPLSPGTAGEATQPRFPGTHCWMLIARPLHGVYYQCLTVVHEFGHWMGLGHSADTSSPMAAVLNPTIYVRGCAKLSRGYVTRITHTRLRMR